MKMPYTQNSFLIFFILIFQVLSGLALAQNKRNYPAEVTSVKKMVNAKTGGYVLVSLKALGKLTSDSASDSELEHPPYFPGDHIGFIKKSAENFAGRVYTITSVYADNPQKLELGIRVYPNPSEKGSSAMALSLAVGDRVVLGPHPRGAEKSIFNDVQVCDAKEAALISFGAGITQNMAILRYLVQKYPQLGLFFLQSFPVPEHDIFKGEIEALSKSGKIQVAKTIITAGPTANAECKHLTKEQLRKFLNINGQYNQDSDAPLFTPGSPVYLCGKREATKDIYNYLKDLGIEEKDIYYQLYW